MGFRFVSSCRADIQSRRYSLVNLDFGRLVLDDTDDQNGNGLFSI